MTDVTELLSEIAHQSIQLSADGDQLSVRAPKGALTPELVSRLTLHKAAILQLLNQRTEQEREGGLFEIEPDAQQAHLPFPLAEIQKAYWVGRSDGMEMGNVGCHFYQEFDCDGVDVQRLESAWQRLIERHGMLRARALPEAEQCMAAEAPCYRIEETDLRALDNATREAELQAIRANMSHRIFDLQQWPLFDLRATHISDQITRIHVGIDLFIADAASIFRLFREWGELYADPTRELPRLTLTFRDYVLEEQSLRKSGRFRAAEQYWRKRIETLPAAPELPLAKRPDEVARPRFARRKGFLDEERWERLKSRGAQAGLTASALLSAVFAEVLSAWSKSHRFTLNVTLFNRLPLHPDVNNIVGDFTSTILLAWNGRPESFETRAQQLQAQLAEDLTHSQLSGVWVLQEMNRAHTGDGTHAMPVVFTSLLGHRGSRDQAGSPAAWLGNEVFSISQTPQVWLDHHVYEECGRLHYNWDAVDELFPLGMLDDMMGAFGRLLGRLAESDEEWKKTALALAPAGQLRQRALINSVVARPPQGLLHSGFEAAASRHPEQPAIVSGRRSLTYGELLAAARSLARRLCRQGAAPNTLVAVVMEKGWEQVAAALGILMAGAAYLPVDSALPEERLRYMLQHGEVRIAVTQSWIADMLEWPDGIERISVDSSFAEEPAGAPLEPHSRAEDLAYVIYTSGSTGEPKGVMIEHRSALNTIAEINNRFTVGPNDRVLALSSLSFDLSVYDIFGVLASGGTIVLPDAGSGKDPAEWLALIRRERVTLWNSVPALMRILMEFVEGLPDAGLDTLRLVMMSGDWIPVSLPDRIRRHAHSAQVVSLGGATEASIWSIWYEIAKVEQTWTSIPYGVPMRNQTFHVLNERLEDCPVWVPGRLFIGGAGLARGYWRDEVLTNRRFFVHPRTSERLYETGDLGRYLPDGTIEFLGREDFQVKIGGHRVELGEIETALLAHPGVKAAVVTVGGEARGDKHLIAYVVRHGERSGMPNADSVQRAAFKLREPGIRADLNGSGISLASPPAEELRKEYLARCSSRTFGGTAVASRQIGEWLAQLKGIQVDGSPLLKYRYPSAGSLYPVQAYLYARPGRVQGIDAGFYYYHPREHRLMQVSESALEANVHDAENQPIFESSAFSLFLVGELQAIEPMYGDLARDFCLVEAGYMSQLLMSAASKCGLGVCPIGGLDFNAVRERLGLSDTAILAHSMVGGLLDGEPNLPFADLRTYLKTKLPDYMVPAAFVMMGELPLTSNGKVDRKRLPAPGLARPDAAPRSDLEEILSRAACEIFGLERIGINDNFFELGGTSLHLVQLQRRLRATQNREIPVARLFAHPTVSSLAAFMAEEQAPPKILRQAQERARKRREALGQ